MIAWAVEEEIEAKKTGLVHLVEETGMRKLGTTEEDERGIEMTREEAGTIGVKTGTKGMIEIEGMIETGIEEDLMTEEMEDEPMTEGMTEEKGEELMTEEMTGTETETVRFYFLKCSHYKRI